MTELTVAIGVSLNNFDTASLFSKGEAGSSVIVPLGSAIIALVIAKESDREVKIARLQGIVSIDIWCGQGAGSKGVDGEDVEAHGWKLKKNIGAKAS